MLKIVIVDDEKVIRDGLEIIISENNAQYFCRKASDGVIALEMIHDETPDVVLLDIQMPNMNGIELIRELNLNYPDIKKIVLSGFDDFNYVRETMKDGALDYLLKPVDEKQLIELLEKVEEDITVKRTSKEREASIESRFQENIEFLKEKFLNELICDGKHTDPNAVFKILNNYNTNITDKYQNFAVIVVLIDNYKYLSDKLEAAESAAMRLRLREAAVDALETDKEFCLFDTDKEFIIVCSFPDKKNDERLNDLANTLYSKLFHTDIRFTIGVSDIVDGLTALHPIYIKLTESLRRRFYKKQSSIITSSKNGKEFAKLTGNPICMDFIDQMNFCVKTEDTKKLQSAIDLFEVKLHSLFIDPKDIPPYLANAFTKIQNENLMFKKCTETTEDCENSYNKTIPLFDSLDAMMQYTVDSYCNGINKMKSISTNKDRRIVNQVKDHINKNYDKKLSLYNLAEMVYLNPNYLSEIFKNQSNENLIDYITRIRIEKAMEYFKKTRCKTGEIGQMVGYEDSAYFSRVFKKITGVSPSQYRKVL